LLKFNCEKYTIILILKHTLSTAVTPKPDWIQLIIWTNRHHLLILLLRY